MGDVRKPISNKSWKKEYLPTFRLPYQNEIDSIKNHSDFGTQLKEYSFGKKDFLWKWNKYFLATSPGKNIVILKHSIYSIEINHGNDLKINGIANSFTDEILIDKKLEFTNTKYLDLGNPDGSTEQYGNKYPYEEKGWFGQMKFVVVGIDNNNRPIIADPIKLQNEDSLDNKIYRMSFNKTLEPQQLPK